MAVESTGNPFRDLATKQGWSNQELAQRLGLAENQIRSLVNAQAACVIDSWREGIEAAGLDFDQVRRDYASYRDHLNGVTPPAQIDPEAFTDTEKRILEAIAKGIRGVNNLAKDADVPRGIVAQFLRSEKFERSGVGV